MHDLPPDLPRLRTLRDWHAMWVERLDTVIARTEEREAAEAELRRRHAPPPPAWLVEPDRFRRALHAGDCARVPAVAAPVTEAEALLELQQGTIPCADCQPDVKLGYLE